METKYEHRLTAVEDKAERNKSRIEKLEKRQDSLEKLTTTVEVLALREAAVEGDVKEIKSDVKTLTNQPAKRYNDLVDKAIWAVLAGGIGFVLAHFGF